MPVDVWRETWWHLLDLKLFISMGRTQAAFAVFLLVVCAATRAQCKEVQFIHTGVDDGHFYDASGRVRIFHGINRVMKGFPWYFENFRTASNETYDFIQSLGVSTLRLGFMWSGFNPSPGYYNTTYLEIMKDTVRRLADRGIHAFLDMHQDVLSTKFCLYDGVPLWVINKSKSEHPHPWPFKGNCSSRGWMANTLSQAAATAYQDIYDNKYGMLDDLAEFWKRTADAFKDEPGVLGYEIMNEPFAGNFYKDPSLLLPGNGGKNLQRMHDYVAKAIRQVDETHIIMYEPVTWGMIFNGGFMGSGYSHVPGGDLYRNRSAMSFHYYCSTFDPNYQKEPAARKLTCDSIIGPHVFKAIKEDVSQIGGASIMTEGLSCPSMNDNEYNEGECWTVVGMLDDGLYSWTDYSNSQHENGLTSLTDAQKALWSRSYMRACAGKPLNMSFDRSTSELNACYTIDATIDAPTEIFASLDYHYKSGLKIETTPNIIASPGGAEANATGFRIIVVPSSKSSHGTDACVRLTRA